MSTPDRPPNARLVFRLLALGVAFVCTVLAGIFRETGGWGLPASMICLMVGGMMGVIGFSGWGPLPRQGQRGTPN